MPGERRSGRRLARPPDLPPVERHRADPAPSLPQKSVASNKHWGEKLAMPRRLFAPLAGILLYMTTTLHAREASGYAADLDHFFQRVELIYAYDENRGFTWEDWRQVGRDGLGAVETDEQFGALLAHLLEHFHDHHAQVQMRLQGGQLPMPTASAVWAVPDGGHAIIEQTASSGYAGELGLSRGARITRLNGRTVEDAVRDRLPALLRENPGYAARTWALNALLTGRRGELVSLEVETAEGPQAVVLDPAEALRAAARARDGLLESRRISHVAYLRPHNSLGEHALIAAFDQAMDGMRDCRAVILDLRDTPSGGNTDVARGIIGRFIAQPGPYQMHELVAVERLGGIKRAWQEWVYPRGDFVFEGPVYVLVDRWTGSMGEGLAMGMHGLGRATVAGTPMARLLGAVYTETLPATGSSYNLPAEKLFHVDGTPREAFGPDRDLSDRLAQTPFGDPILALTLAEIGRISP